MPLPRQGKGGIDLATYTTNYGLHQWEASDNFLRTDFNTDHQLIDGALADKAEVTAGTYTGDGTAQRTIELDRAPAAVLLFDQYGNANVSYYAYGGLALEGHPCSKSGDPTITLTGSGFTVYYQQQTPSHFVATNYSGAVFHYLAFFL